MTPSTVAVGIEHATGSPPTLSRLPIFACWTTLTQVISHLPLGKGRNLEGVCWRVSVFCFECLSVKGVCVCVLREEPDGRVGYDNRVIGRSVAVVYTHIPIRRRPGDRRWQPQHDRRLGRGSFPSPRPLWGKDRSRRCGHDVDHLHHSIVVRRGRPLPT